MHAREFYLNYKIYKKTFLLFYVSEIFEEKKKQIKKIICSFIKKSNVDENSLRYFVESNFKDLVKMDFNQYKDTVEFTFDKSLCTFIMKIENNKSRLNGMIDKSKGSVEYPNWLVKSLKSKQ